MTENRLPNGNYLIRRDRGDVWYPIHTPIDVDNGVVRGRAWTGQMLTTIPDEDEWDAITDAIRTHPTKAGPSTDYRAGTAYLNTDHTPKRNRK
jgi:hypothetical protein